MKNFIAVFKDRLYVKNELFVQFEVIDLLLMVFTELPALAL